ncbi:hypothetical protein GJAV_G00169190 [Gymnothorax javanicus]|nr:hypothetical protein GJAV_G00169190 [Gymnothorax javanicus]
MIMSCDMQTIDKGSEEKLLIEMAKQQILSKLNLKERPNITQTVPRAALLTALRKLHAGRVRQDGSFELENSLQSAGAKDQGYEVVSFADTSNPESNSAQPSLTFQFAQERGKNVLVLQSSLWLYVHTPEAASRDSRATAQIFLSGQNGRNRTLLLQKTLELQRGGWHSFPVTHALQDFLDGGRQQLQLEASCGYGGQDLCAQASASDPSHRPFLVAQVRLRDDDDASGHGRSKRSLRCGEEVTVCCKKDFYIKFRDIEWHEWIIAPEGYHMNYCIGKCPPHLAGSPGIASSFHAAVLSELKASGIHTAGSCCAPVQRRPLSMVYFNSQHSIIKTDMPDMIVESCGCT